MTSLNLRAIRKNAEWGGILKKRGALAEASTLYTFKADQLCYIESPQTESIVNKVTAGLKLGGSGKPHRERAIRSLLNACFESFHNEPEEVDVLVGILWPTSTSEEPASKYKQKLFSPAAKKAAAANLEAHGYLTFHKGGRDKTSFVPGLVSVVVPTDKLRAVYEAVLSVPFSVVEHHAGDRELVILKDASKRLQDYTDDGFTIANRELLRSVNKINHSYSWSFTRTSGARVDIPPSSLSLTRLFLGGSFRVYGRFHCAAQGLSKGDRTRITINGEETVELDYSATVASIAYAMSGRASDEWDPWTCVGDPYELGVYPRQVVKRAFMTCLNASSRSEAFRALLQEGFFEDSKECTRFIDGLIQRHSRIKHYFFTEAWRVLSFEESEIMRCILELFRNFERPVLPVHDGVVCREVDSVMVANFMRDAFEGRLGVAAAITMSKGAAVSSLPKIRFRPEASEE